MGIDVSGAPSLAVARDERGLNNIGGNNAQISVQSNMTSACLGKVFMLRIFLHTRVSAVNKSTPCNLTSAPDYAGCASRIGSPLLTGPQAIVSASEKQIMCVQSVCKRVHRYNQSV